MTFILPSLKYPIIVITFFFVLFRMFRPMKASDGSKSNTLTGLFAATMIIFTVTVIDSINDRPEVSSQTNETATAKGVNIVRKRTGATALQAAKSRNVIKEKYGILLMVWVGFSILYLLSHRSKDIQLMGIRFLMAIRGKHNPLENEEPINSVLVERVRNDWSEETKEWVIRVILAQKGIVSEVNEAGLQQAKNENKKEREDLHEIPDFLKQD